MKLKTNASTLALSLSAATLLTSTAMAQDANTDKNDNIDPKTKGQCHGVNSCKGQTACATAEGSCAGTNSCAGKGWLLKTKVDCDKLEGKFVPFKKKK